MNTIDPSYRAYLVHKAFTTSVGKIDRTHDWRRKFYQLKQTLKLKKPQTEITL